MHLRILNRWHLFFCLVVFFNACDHGLAPDDANEDLRTGIRGLITYTGTWPADSLIFDLRLVVFQNIPADSSQIISDVVQGKAFIYPENLAESLPFGVSMTPYEMTLEPGFYEYIVIAQQYGSILQWRLVGQYDTSPGDSLPTGINVIENSMLNNIDIRVDWDNPPVLPF